MEANSTAKKIERAVLVAVKLPDKERWETDDLILELKMLVETAGAIVIHSVIQEKKEMDPKYFIGKGKAEEIKSFLLLQDAEMIVFDDELSPAQIRNLETLIQRKILDRTAIILDIFAKHARSRESKTQVELAQLEYTYPRLTRMWTHLSRQAGGGVGLRGPGETQLETDKRIIKTRMAFLRDELDKIERQRHTQKKGRQEMFQVALVGYTNVGKSTIMKAITGADVLIEDKLFATLDSTVRKVFLSKEFEILLADTVGFIRKLPHSLVASFKSTLDSAASANLILHVIDMSHPHFELHIKTVNEVLQELGAGSTKQLMIFNKVDRVNNDDIFKLIQEKYPSGIIVSASKRLRLQRIKDEILQYIESNYIEKEFRIVHRQAGIVSSIYALASVLEESYEQDGIHIRCKLSIDDAQRIEKMIEKLSHEHAIEDFLK